MRGINPGEVWIIDFGMAAKVRPALLLTGKPHADELDLVTVLLHTTALRGNRWELIIDKPFLKSGAFSSPANSNRFYRKIRATAGNFEQRGNESRAHCCEKPTRCRT